MKGYSKQQQQYPSSRQGTFVSAQTRYSSANSAQGSFSSKRIIDDVPIDTSSRKGKIVKEQFGESPMGRIKEFTDVLSEDISMKEIKYNVELISKLTNTDYV